MHQLVLHIPDHSPPMAEFGILIPPFTGRAERVLATLRADPEIASVESEWLVAPKSYSIDREDLDRVHEKRYLDRIFSDEISAVFEEVFELFDEDGKPHRYAPDRAARPLSDLLAHRLGGIAGTYQTCLSALDADFCFYFGGGSHHAHPGFGHGFCLLNDACVAIRRLQAEGSIATAWIIDLDAHKGDGTAAIMSGDDSVTTVSVHMAHGWPLDGPARLEDGSPNPSYTPSDFDIPISSGEEAHYLPRLTRCLDALADRERPDLAVVLLGADPYEHDALPSTEPMEMSLDQLESRDRLVYKFLRGNSIPQAHLMAGGYGDRAWEPYPALLRLVIRTRLGLPPL